MVNLYLRNCANLAITCTYYVLSDSLTFLPQHVQTVSVPPSPGDELEVVPTSSDLMFVPQSRKHTVSEGT